MIVSDDAVLRVRERRDCSTGHDQHDAQLDYYGKRLATCSSDRTVKVFDVVDGQWGDVLGRYQRFIWLRANAGNTGGWTKIKEHGMHSASVNSIAWAPHELGSILACASSDGNVSVLKFNNDGTWAVDMVAAHPIGCNAVSWAPATVPGSLLVGQTRVRVQIQSKDRSHRHRLDKRWRQPLDQDHSDPQRSLPSNGTLEESNKFKDTLWRTSFSLSGNVLAVSCGDGMVYLFKESIKGGWECVSELNA
ncbi:hypothetical protein L7F22_038661 [Adiantum nelumboides]|nr:hypothetical protein [Adiantum nelumboides]